MPDLPIFEELVSSTSLESYVRVIAARPLDETPVEPRPDGTLAAVHKARPVVSPGLVGYDPVGSLNERLTSLRAQKRRGRGAR